MAYVVADWSAASTAFPASAPSLHNPDFVEVVIHSYRHRYGLVDGDPRYQRLENLLAHEPPITVTAVVLESGDDGVGGPVTARRPRTLHRPLRTSAYSGAGHNVPQEAPEAFAEAVASLLP